MGSVSVSMHGALQQLSNLSAGSAPDLSVDMRRDRQW